MFFILLMKNEFAIWAFKFILGRAKIIFRKLGR